MEHKNRTPELGDRIVPLSGGRYHRHALGTPLTVDRVDWSRGMIFARENAREALGWHIDPRKLGQPRTKPYLLLSDPYAIGLSDADMADLERVAAIKQQNLRVLNEQVEAWKARIENGFLAKAAMIQDRADERTERRTAWPEETPVQEPDRASDDIPSAGETPP